MNPTGESRNWLPVLRARFRTAPGLPVSEPPLASHSLLVGLILSLSGPLRDPRLRKELQPFLRGRRGDRSLERLARENVRLRRELELLGRKGGQRAISAGRTHHPQPLSQLEATLNSLTPKTLTGHPELLDSLHQVELSLERIWREMEPDVTEKELRRLVVETMRLSLDLWQQSTSTSKAELARRSGQWSVYVNQDGWERTQGFDRYLDIVTLPENPRLKKVLCTGDFVVETCTAVTPLRQRLEASLDRLRSLHATVNLG